MILYAIKLATHKSMIQDIIQDVVLAGKSSLVIESVGERSPLLLKHSSNVLARLQIK